MIMVHPSFQSRMKAYRFASDKKSGVAFFQKNVDVEKKNQALFVDGGQKSFVRIRSRRQ